jgi:hypothetical protein
MPKARGIRTSKGASVNFGAGSRAKNVSKSTGGTKPLPRGPRATVTPTNANTAKNRGDAS